MFQHFSTLQLTGQFIKYTCLKLMQHSCNKSSLHEALCVQLLVKLFQRSAIGCFKSVFDPTLSLTLHYVINLNDTFVMFSLKSINYATNMRDIEVIIYISGGQYQRCSPCVSQYQLVYLHLNNVNNQPVVMQHIIQMSSAQLSLVNTVDYWKLCLVTVIFNSETQPLFSYANPLKTYS